MEKLVLDGKTFVKASSAAEALGYTSDYVGQLCRAEKVEAHLVGRSWYVNQEQLRGHKKEKRRLSKVKAREQVKHSLRQAQEAASGEKAYASRITYQSDDEALIPTVTKLSVNTSEAETEDTATNAKIKKRKKKTKKAAKETEPDYTVENKGEKTVMSGSLEVHDASEETSVFDADATTFHAQIMTEKSATPQKTKKKRSIKETKAISVKETDTLRSDELGADEKQTTFREKLSEYDTQEDAQAKKYEIHGNSEKINGTQHAKQNDRKQNLDTEVPTTQQRVVIWPAYAALIGVLAVAAVSVALESTWVVQTGDAVMTGYTFNVEHLVYYVISLY